MPSSSMSLVDTVVDQYPNVIGMTSTETYGKRCNKWTNQECTTAAANSQDTSTCSVGWTVLWRNSPLIKTQIYRFKNDGIWSLDQIWQPYHYYKILWVFLWMRMRSSSLEAKSMVSQMCNCMTAEPTHARVSKSREHHSTSTTTKMATTPSRNAAPTK